MKLNGFTPYDTDLVRLYNNKNWWLGMTMGDTLDKAADLYPQREALVGCGQRYTYAQLREKVDTMAYHLLQKGLKPGDRILLQLPNWPEFVISYYALQKAGLVMVLLTVNHTAREIIHLADLTQPKGWILPLQYHKTDFLSLIKSVCEDIDGLKIILADEDPPLDYLKLSELFSKHPDQGEVDNALANVRPDPGAVCQILPSGGTTGLPKGAPRTHNDYLCNVEYSAKAWDINATDTCLVMTTVGHNLALLLCVTGPIFQGAKVVMLDSMRPEDFCEIVQAERVTSVGLVPTLISRILSYDSLDAYDLSSLYKTYVGAANSPRELVQKEEEKLGCRYINAFGMVEGPLSQTRPEDPLGIRCDTIGRPCCPYDEIVILDPMGKLAPVGVEGELAARGPGIFTGYYQNPQANETAFTADGYFLSGDLAVKDAVGNIRITGRIKDIIIRGGENIAAQEVEELISMLPNVEYVSVVGMPDSDLGEKVCAYIKPVMNQNLTHQEVVEHMEKMGVRKILIPERVELLENLPQTAAGKVDKKVLRSDIIAKLKKEEEAEKN